MLTSMVKLVGAASVETWKEEMNGTWQPGIKALGLKENAVDWAYDDNNKSLITDEMKSLHGYSKSRHYRRQNQDSRLHV